MSTPGWYPDPAGQPNSFRYWNGQSWSHETSPSPYVAPPGSAPPPPPPTQPMPVQSPAQQPAWPVQPTHPSQPAYGGGSGWSPAGPPPPPPASGGAGTKVALILLVIVLVAGVGVGGFFGVRALTDDSDDSSASDESSVSTEPSESADGSESPTEAESATIDPSPATELPSTAPTAIPAACTAGAPEGGKAPGAVLRGGGLQAPKPAEFAPMGLDSVFTFADKVATVGRQIETNWVAVYALGGLSRATGYSSLEQAAESVLTCMTGSDSFYQGFTGRTDQGSSAISVGGHEAWRITSEVRVDNPQVTEEGDVATVIVVDTGAAGTYGLFVSVVPIGNADLIGQQEQVAGALEVR
jgi:hypothetical protein